MIATKRWEFSDDFHGGAKDFPKRFWLEMKQLRIKVAVIFLILKSAAV